MADIVSVPSGNFTPGALATLQYSAAVINATWNLANTKYATYEAKLEAITDQATGWLATVNAPHVTAGTVNTPSITEPAVDIPSTQSSDVMSLFDTKYLELVTLLVDRFKLFRTTYFPDEQATYAAAEDWLQAALANPKGLPDAVVSALMTDDYDRLMAEATRASDSVMAQFATRRFPLPPGAAASAVLQIQQKAQDSVAESSRKVILASIEQLRFVVQQTLGLRQSAMDSAVKYITALASGPEMASRLIGVGYDAQSKLISAASQFYNSRIAAAELTSKVGQFNVGTALEAAGKNQAADLTLIDDRLKALLMECQALAQMVTSLLNNVHANAGTQYSVSA